MAIKLADTVAPMGNFPAVMADDVDFSDGENLQYKYDNGMLGTIVTANDGTTGSEPMLASLTVNGHTYKLNTDVGIKLEVVESLPTEDISERTIYLMLNGDDNDNIYNEFIYVNETWERIGSKDIDLSEYVKIDDENPESLTTTYSASKIEDVLTSNNVAAKVSYSNTTSKLKSRNVQSAIDEIYSDLIEYREKIPDEAFEILYDDKNSKLDVFNVQQAIDKIVTMMVKILAENVSYDNTETEIDAEYDSVQKILDLYYSIFPKDASELSYDNTNSHATATTVQDMLDELKTNLITLTTNDIKHGTNTLTQTLQTMANNIASIQPITSADGISYDNTSSGMSATNTQAAIDEVEHRVDVVENRIPLNVRQLAYDNSTSGLSATTGQAAIDEVNSKLTEIVQNLDNASDIHYKNNTSGLSALNVQDAIDEIDETIDTIASNVATLQNNYNNLNAANVSYNSSTVNAALNTLSNTKTTVDSFEANTLKNFKTVNGDLTYNGKAVVLGEASFHQMASEISYNGAGVGATEATVQAMLDTLNINARSLKNTVDNIPTKASTLPFTADNKISATKTEAAIREVYDDIPKNATELDFTPTDRIKSTNVGDAMIEVETRINNVIEHAGTAQGIEYDNTTSGMTAKNVQTAIDELHGDLSQISLTSDNVTFDNTGSSLSSTNVEEALKELSSEVDNMSMDSRDITFADTAFTSTNVKDAIVEVNNRVGHISASNSDYVNTASKLSATNVQGAIDEVVSNINNLSLKADHVTFNNAGTDISATNMQSATVELKNRIEEVSQDSHDAENTSYDNTISQYQSTNVQDVIDEMAVKVNGIVERSKAKSITYENTYSTLEATNAQDALDELDNKFNTLNAHDAKYISYDNRTSGVDSENVQNALDRAFSDIVLVDNSVKALSFQKLEMPEVCAEEVGKVYQYIGETTDEYQRGHFYKCYKTQDAYREWISVAWWYNVSNSFRWTKERYPSAYGNLYTNMACTNRDTQYRLEKYDASGDRIYTNYPGIQARWMTFNLANSNYIDHADIYSWIDITSNEEDTVIQDDITSNKTTYSSTKIEDLFTTQNTNLTTTIDAVKTEVQIYADEKIDDTSSSITTTYSSNKEDELLDTKYDKANVWTGTRAEYKVAKNDIPEGALINITDDDDSALYVGDVKELIDVLEPVGKIMAYMGLKAPKNYLICDGGEYNIADYPKLAAHFAEEFGSVDYFGGDGTTTFKIPDLRGEFLRGTGTNNYSEQGNGSEVGEHQDGSIINSLFKYGNDNIIYIPYKGQHFYSITPESADSTILLPQSSGRSLYKPSSTDSYSETTVNAYTARPTNTSVLYCIKYQ